jgi:2',3'-cyclic-nucleotide 2'-phosphodiesterase/3'-nucleotidase/5'-nucleotidase
VSHQRSLTILHTNDFHNHFDPDQAAYVKRRKTELGPNVLLLDAGDAISAGNVGFRIGGEPILDLMSDTGYDAMTMGNREFHVADALLRHKIGSARFPILCANMRYQKKAAGGEALPVQASLSRTLPNGLKVSVIGVTVPMVTPKMTARVISAYLFDDPVTVVQRWITTQRDKADVLIALTHIGYKEDQRLADSCPELDLIIGGHSHVVLNTAQIQGSVPIVQAGWYGHYLGKVDMSVGLESVEITHSSLEDLKSTKAKIGK